MQIPTEIALTFIGSLILSLTITPAYMLVINKLNKIIQTKAKQPQTLLEFSKVGVGFFVLAIIFLLPIELISTKITNSDLAKDCISVHMGTYAICFITILVILHRTGRIQTIWKISSK